jgi:phenylalanine-4-hydroxylase
MVSGEHPALGEKVSTVSFIPLKANEPHDVGSILRELAEVGLYHLMPNIVHDVQLHVASLVFLSAYKEIDEESMYFIMIV